MKVIFVLTSAIFGFLIIALFYNYFFRIPQIVNQVSIQASPTSILSPFISPTSILPTGNNTIFCKSTDLTALISEEPAAGNIYGRLTIKNISSVPCQIHTNNFVTPKYIATNITVVHTGNQGAAFITLKPGESAYSQVHYPNGPQCNGPAEQSTITFSYQISPSETVEFKDQSGKAEQSIMVCSSPSQMTQVDVWGISTTPISG